MAKLSGKAVGDVITEYYGPITGKNYNVIGAATPVAPVINVRVVGTGSVTVQQNVVYDIVSESGAPNAFTMEKRADAASWTTVSAGITQASGIVAAAPAVNAAWTVIRVIVAAVGDGKVTVQSDWV